MVVQTYGQKSSVQNEDASGEGLYSQLKDALSDVGLQIGGTVNRPQITNFDLYTGETLSPETFEDRIYEFGANLWLGEQYGGLVTKLEQQYGENFVEELSDDYKKILASDADKINHYAAEGIIEPVLGERTEHIVYDGKVVGTVSEPTGYTNYKFTEKGEEFLNENPKNNPELRDLTGGRTPRDDKRRTRWGRVAGGATALLFGGAIASGLASNDSEAPGEKEVRRSSTLVASGPVVSYYLSHNWNDNPGDDSVGVSIKDASSYFVNNGTGGMSSQEFYEMLNWVAYPYDDLPNVKDPSGMIELYDYDQSGDIDDVKFIGPDPNHEAYQSTYDGTPVTTSAGTSNGSLVIMKDGQSHHVNGVDFDLVLPEKGPLHNFMENPAKFGEYLNATKDLGVNAIHVKAPINMEDGMQFLDAAHEAGLDVYVDLNVEWNEDNQTTQDRAQRVVSAYKNHPAVAGWDLGEYESDDTFVNETLAPLVKSLDPNHIVTAKTDAGNLTNATQNLTNIDAIEVYAFGQANFAGLWNQFANASHPIILTHGASSHDGSGGSDEAAQAQMIESQYDDIMNNTGRAPNTNNVAGTFLDGLVDQLWIKQNGNPRVIFGDTVQGNLSEEYTGVLTPVFNEQTGTWEIASKQAYTDTAVRFDTHAPTGAVSGSPEGLTNQSDITVVADGLDNALMQGISIELVGGNPQIVYHNESAKQISHSQTFTGLDDGQHSAIVTFTDAAGLQTQILKQYIVDTTAPNATYTGTTVDNGTINVTQAHVGVIASDVNGIESIVANLYDNVTKELLSSEATPVDFDVEDGRDYAMNATVIDNAGNPFVLPTIYFGVDLGGNETGQNNNTTNNPDQTAPTVWFEADSDPEGPLTATRIYVNASAQDEFGGSGLAELRAELLDENLVVVRQNMSLTSPLQVTFGNVTPLAPGAYQVRLTGVDNAGNPNVTVRSYSLFSNPTGDNTAPEAWLGPNATTPGVHENQSWIYLDILAADNATQGETASGLERILANITEVDGPRSFTTEAAGDHLTSNLSVGPGRWQIAYAAHDRAGNVFFADPYIITLGNQSVIVDNCTDADPTNDENCTIDIPPNGTDTPSSNDKEWYEVGWDRTKNWIIPSSVAAAGVLGWGYVIRKWRGRGDGEAPAAEPEAPAPVPAPEPEDLEDVVVTEVGDFMDSL